MKNVILVLSILASHFAGAQIANNPLVKFQVIAAQFDPAQVGINIGASFVDINYNIKQVTLTVTHRYFCPPGAECLQSMPMPTLVTLPIVAVQVDACGMKTISALTDARPYDGSLEQIVVQDYSNVKCEYFIPYQSTASYTTQFFNRRTGQQETHVSKMGLKPDSMIP